MKKIFTFILLLLTAALARAHEYIPFPTANVEWTVVYVERACEDGPFYVYLYSYQLYGDTTISGTVYKKLGVKTINSAAPTVEIIGGIREEDRKVYYQAVDSHHPLGSHEPGEEKLLFDFNMNAGDALPPGYLSANLSIQAIDSVQIGGVYRKRLNLGPTFYNGQGKPEYWVEGIGSTTVGLISALTGIPTCGVHQMSAVCTKIDGNTVYLNPDFEDCNITAILAIPGTPKWAQIKIFPNPALASEIHINGIDPADGIQARIVDYTGRTLTTKVLKQRDNILKIPLQTPFCLLILSDEEGRTIHIEKVIAG